MISRRSTTFGRALATAAVAAVVLLHASPATAMSGPGPGESVVTGSAFGEHVAGCARGAGFSGTHNPGMHQGAHGWDRMHATPGVS